MALHTIALCAGGGGLELGLSLVADTKVICFVEREAYAAATLVARMEDEALDPAPVWDDLTTFDGKPWRGKVDLITAGFPCQPFSCAGKGQGTRDDRWIWDDIARIIGEVRPSTVFLENVRGLLFPKQIEAFRRILRSLADLGYDAEWGCVRASGVGAPHRRERVFILGVANNDDNGCLREGLHLSECGSQQTIFDIDGPVEKLFPPGPDDREAWAEVLAVRPDLAPALDYSLQVRNRPEDEEISTRRDAPDDTSGELADAEDSDGRSGIDEAEGAPARQRRRGSSGEGLGLFPPGPDDRSGWAEVLAVRPDLAPALGDTKAREHQREQTEAKTGEQRISTNTGANTNGQQAPQSGLRGVADGMARAMVYRTDRLRLLGNGVVPLQAAYAWCALWDRIVGGTGT